MRSAWRQVLVGAALLATCAGATGFAADAAKLTARTAATQHVDFDVFLPVENRAGLEQLLDSLHNSNSPDFHKWLTPAEFNARFGVSGDKLSAIENELRSMGLTVAVVAPRQLHVSGSAKDVEAAFASELKTGRFANGSKTVAFSEPFQMPSSIRAAQGVVTGLSGKFRMRVHSMKTLVDTATPENRYSTTGPYWFTDLKEAYRFPSLQAYDGTGVTIGVLVSGNFQPKDIEAYFAHEKIKAPSITTVKIAGGGVFGAYGSDETELDLEQTGGMAPKAHLVYYNVPVLSDGDIFSALTTVLDMNVVDVLSMSFGIPEKFFTAEYNGGQDLTDYLQIYDDLFAQGNAQGITFVASSGDAGALDVPPLACFDPKATSACGRMQPSLEIPASSPHVTAVGGTNLVTSSIRGSLSSVYVSENADDDPLMGDIFYGTPAAGAVWGSGGGESIYFRKPVFQTLAKTGSKFRTVPDVSLHMGGCPRGAVMPCGPDRSGDILVFNSSLYIAIGTSASAPDFAGLVALKIQRDRSRQGNVNYLLYADSFEQMLGLKGDFRDEIPGYNGYYSTRPGYDQVLGVGTVRGLNFLEPSKGTAAAGTPQTPSNP